MIVLDTTVLVYAKGAAHPLRAPCRQLVEAIADRRLPATTTVEVIQEFAHVRARRCGRTDAAALAGDYAELLSPLLGVAQEQLHRGLSVFARAERLGALDCVLAAAAGGNRRPRARVSRPCLCRCAGCGARGARQSRRPALLAT